MRYWLVSKLVAEARSKPKSMAFVSFDTVKSRDYVAGLHGFGIGQESILRIAGTNQVPAVKKCRS